MMEHYEMVEGGWSVAVQGAGGGGGGSESPDTLKSRAQSSTVSILSEGEIKGFLDNEDPLKKIFLDDGSLEKSNSKSYMKILRYSKLNKIRNLKRPR